MTTPNNHLLQLITIAINTPNDIPTHTQTIPTNHHPQIINEATELIATLLTLLAQEWDTTPQQLHQEAALETQQQ